MIESKFILQLIDKFILFIYWFSWTIKKNSLKVEPTTSTISHVSFVTLLKHCRRVPRWPSSENLWELCRGGTLKLSWNHSKVSKRNPIRPKWNWKTLSSDRGFKTSKTIWQNLDLSLVTSHFWKMRNYCASKKWSERNCVSCTLRKESRSTRNTKDRVNKNNKKWLLFWTLFSWKTN